MYQSINQSISIWSHSPHRYPSAPRPIISLSVPSLLLIHIQFIRASPCTIYNCIICASLSYYNPFLSACIIASVSSLPCIITPFPHPHPIIARLTVTLSVLAVFLRFVLRFERHLLRSVHFSASFRLDQAMRMEPAVARAREEKRERAAEALSRLQLLVTTGQRPWNLCAFKFDRQSINRWAIHGWRVLYGGWRGAGAMVIEAVQ